MLKFLIRTVLFLMGLALAAALAGVVLLLGAAWALRSGWLRLTGRPVAPWTMRFDPRAGFGRFRAAAAAPTAAEVVSARAQGRAARRGPMAPGDAAADVTDVAARPAASLR